MATTTNFGWETPDDTDLVKDGAAAMRTLGNSIDTSFVDLKGGTTGQVLSKASGTDLDFTWVAQDDSNAIQNAIVDAKGDLIAATAADTPARLAVGTNGHVLTADSTAATGLAWAAPVSGSMTLLSTTTANSGTTTQTVSSISTAYKSLKIIVTNLRNNGGVTYQARLNGDTGTNYIQGYAGQFWGGYDGAVAKRSTIILGNRNSNQTDWSRQGYGVFDLYNYNAAGQCIMQYTSFNHDDSTNNDTFTFTEGIVVYNASAAVTSFSLIADSNFTSGTIYVYGVN